MRTVRNVLFPFDGSPLGKQMAPIVRDICRQHGAALTVLHVLEMPTAVYLDVPTLAFMVDAGELERTRREQTITELASVFTGLEVHYVVRSGAAAHTILDEARHRDADLIIMPTHGCGRFRALLLGSVTAKVLHDAECPVLTSQHAEQLQPEFRCERILCAVDLEVRTPKLLAAAAELAKEYTAQLTIVHAIPHDEGPLQYLDDELAGQLCAEARQRLAPLAAATEGHPALVIKAGRVGNVVRQAAIDHRADLIVAHRGHLTERFGRLRGHVQDIIRTAPCPVLTL